MDPKLFTTLEYLFIGVLLIAVLFAGGVFGEEVWGAPEAAPTQSPVLPTAAATPASEPAATPVPPTDQPPPSTRAPSLSQDATNYQIVSGDTCSGIAFQFNVSLDSLIAANNLGPDCLIRAGDVLIVPRPTATLAP